MKNKFFGFGLNFLVVTAILLVSCTTSKTSSTTKTTVTPITSTTTAVSGNWWDKLGAPQYGGTINLRLAADVTAFDPDSIGATNSIMANWMELLFANDWTVDPATFNFTTFFVPTAYQSGQLATSYEMTDPNTIVVHLRQGVHWQNIPPANGREFTADDVVYKFDRLLGLGDGFTQISPLMQVPVFLDLKSVTATDNYTVVFNFQGANVESIYEGVLGTNIPIIECPDVVKAYGNTSDWHHAIGTGPFILQDFVSGSSATLVNNSNYWGYDERYPNNKLPYVNGVNYYIIPDNATAEAELRTGKLDALDGLQLSDTKTLTQATPQLLDLTYPNFSGMSLDMKDDVKPFNDINVRIALQKSINLQDIATNYYGGTVDPSPLTMTSYLLTGWTYPYSQWPQDLKDTYAYDPTAAKQLLTNAGYPNGFDTDCVASQTADLNLLQIIKGDFAAINVNMTITTMDATSFANFVQAGHKQDALSYKATSVYLGFDYPPMDEIPSFQTGGSYNIGNISDPTIDALIAKGEAVTSNIADIKQAMVDINTRVAEQHYTISLLNPGPHAVYWPWFKGYSGQSSAISGVMEAGALPGFYLSRFWIDQSMKTSMGY